ncbi:hypothetical protein PAHAL_2G218600 [Panicum hallii]|uniref:Uncharacterized protein n=1 Tax=Panicum hallii TaxID=206008 RepID=A0A2T8KQ04_9POAL|nr:hypothetical protein PAHAL_2G218600 [Panicum hallii]
MRICSFPLVLGHPFFLWLCSTSLSENIVLGVESREGSAPGIVLHLPRFCSLNTKIC